MIVGDRVVGVLSVDKFEPDFYDEELAELATAFAAQAGIAIENARLLETERAAREQAETLRAAAQSLGSTLGVSQVFDLILSELRKVVPYRSASVQQLDGDEFVIVGGQGYPDLDELIGHRYRWTGPDDPARELVERHETLIVADASVRYPRVRGCPRRGKHQVVDGRPVAYRRPDDRDAHVRQLRAGLLHRRTREDGRGVRRVRRDRDRQGALPRRAAARA